MRTTSGFCGAILQQEIDDRFIDRQAAAVFDAFLAERYWRGGLRHLLLADRSSRANDGTLLYRIKVNL
jgi:hypothetical protein